MPFDQTPISVALAQTLVRRPLATSLCEATFGRVITAGSASPNLPFERFAFFGASPLRRSSAYLSRFHIYLESLFLSAASPHFSKRFVQTVRWLSVQSISGVALARCARREAIGLAEREARTPKGPQGPAPHLPTLGEYTSLIQASYSNVA